MAKIVVVDDETNILELIRFNLEKDGHQVLTSTGGEEGLHLIRSELPDLVILDVMLPEPDGLEICRRLRHDPATALVPILMVSARGETLDRVVGLEMGADDYIAKPFSPRELMARVKAALRRAKQNQQTSSAGRELRCGPIMLDTEKFQVVVAGQPVSFTPKEFKLLKILMSHPGKVFTREQLLDRVWGFDFNVDTRTVDVHIRYVRQKIEPNPANPIYIKTVRGIGYKFSGDNTE
ncbi:winged helix-turn-helix domain-containing protein [Desulforamulus hydrothermalis]|uniref:Stage 0 sporulation protein A homolog n=1 Tax=Desulforamulus hydrothermalis Lam5 = DSM 18033 TaxID=1121428 RepID=K8DX10_9FIRM|nr:response regulator transcription factor [Desulforamulus hydrothermalis]CCO07067.1 DNA-binding response regulator in two-component system with YedV [Desulforamulus hydrothermalis Lam5 = DSM 18033]SHH40560.1 two-component system, OmpR family, alkaline phosphatase synthesis response regulator PhoP [Desulforamulus hydrothermalis Lam5 = DSM 18033]